MTSNIPVVIYVDYETPERSEVLGTVRMTLLSLPREGERITFCDRSGKALITVVEELGLEVGSSIERDQVMLRVSLLPANGPGESIPWGMAQQMVREWAKERGAEFEPSR